MMNPSIRGIDGKIAHGDTHFIDDGANGSAVTVSRKQE